MFGGYFSEVGGLRDTIADAEEIRDELLALGLGIAQSVKSSGQPGVENLDLEWFGMLPGKRESRRYVGDYTIAENDISETSRHSDIVAYGGWPVDDHDSIGTLKQGHSHTFHRFQTPYPVPYRALYSRNIENLMCAGRNISVSHLGLCTTRVIATCAVIGQAVGTAAALAVSQRCSPREVGQKHLDKLQTQLLAADCWLPGKKRIMSTLTQQASWTASSGTPEVLTNGEDRPDERIGQENAWHVKPGEWVEMNWKHPVYIHNVRILFDSNLLRKFRNMPMGYPQEGWDLTPPESLVRMFSISVLDADGKWQQQVEITDNHQRLVNIPINIQTTAVRLSMQSTWGAKSTRIFSFEVE